MKKIFLTLALFFMISPALADICYDITEDVSKKAIEILKNQKEIYKYCSICNNAEEEKITIKEIKSGNPVLINNEGIDLAHTYYKKDEKFINLGIAAGCISADNYGIKEQLSFLPKIHRTREDNKRKATEQAKEIYNQCLKENEISKEHITTANMVVENTLINECLTEAIKKEIRQAFEPEEQERMYNYLQKARTGVHKFYEGLYSFNKYCYGNCGTISVLIPYADEDRLLNELLESILFLNIEKNGY